MAPVSSGLISIVGMVALPWMGRLFHPGSRLVPVLGTLSPNDRWIILATIGAFLLTLVGIGLAFRRFSQDTSDYFRAGARATWWLLGGSLFMQTFSAWTFTGAAGAAFQAGWSLPVMFFANVVMFGVSAAFTAGWFRQLRCVTAADLIRLRYGGGMEQLTAWLGTLTGPLFGGVQLYGLAIFTSTLLGVDVKQAIVVLGVVVLFYSALSGAWAVLAADFIQALVVMPVAILIAALCLWQVGGLGGLLAKIEAAGLGPAYAPIKSPEVLATMDGIDPAWFTLAFYLAWFGNQILNGNTMTNAAKFLTAKDGREARKAAAFAGGLFLAGLVIWFVPPMTARLLIPGEVMAMPLAKPVEGAYAAIAIHLLPPGLVGLVLAGMCAATMSSLDTGLTGLAGNLTQNIYPALCRLVRLSPVQGRARFLLGKLINVFCASIIIGTATMMASFGRGGVFKILMDVLATLGAPVATPMFLGLVLRRVPRMAPYVSLVAGLCVSLSIYLAPVLADAEPWSFHQQVGTVVAVGTIAFLVARMLGRVDEKTTLQEQEFFDRRDRPVDFAAEIGGANDGKQLKVVGAFAAVMGGLILLLLLPQSSTGHCGKILVIAACLLGIGGLMLWRGRRWGRVVSAGNSKTP